MTVSYLDEIMQQPAMLAALAKGLPKDTEQELAQARLDLQSGAFDRVLLTGMGGSLHGAYPLYLQLVRSLGVPVILMDTSELVQQTPEAISERCLMIAISQSGESGEIVEMTRIAPRRPSTVISATNLAGNTLANWADIRLLSNAGPELTVSSKSYTGGLACLHLLGAALVGALPQAKKELARAATACTELLANWEPRVSALTSFLDPKAPLVFAGRGNSFASAQIAALLTQEAAK